MRFVEYNGREEEVYKSIDEFLEDNPIYQAYGSLGETYYQRSKDYRGCSQCEACKEYHEMANKYDLDVIVMKKMHDIIGLVEKA